MANITSRKDREKDFKKLDMLILSLERKADSKDLSVEDLRKYKEAFNKFNNKYLNDPSFGPKDGGIYKPLEYRALIFLAQGDENMADALLREALSLKHKDESWISETAKKWEANNATDLVDIDTENTLHFSGKLEGWLALYTLGFFFTPLLLTLDLFSSLPGLKNELSNTSYAVASDFQSLINFAQFYDVVALLFLGVLAYFFFKKKRATRPVAIAFHGFILIAGFVVYWMLDDLSRKYSVDLTSESSVLTISALIWPFYWIFSKRVRATFVE